MKKENLVAAGAGIAIGVAVMIIIGIFVPGEPLAPRSVYSEYKLDAELFRGIIEESNFSKLFFYSIQRSSERLIKTDIEPEVEIVDGTSISTDRLIQPTGRTRDLGFLNISHPDEAQIYYFSDTSDVQLKTLLKYIVAGVTYFKLEPVEGSTLDPECKGFLAFDLKPFNAENRPVPIERRDMPSFRLNPCPPGKKPK